jgi:hypothetical protein
MGVSAFFLGRYYAAKKEVLILLAAVSIGWKFLDLPFYRIKYF